MASTKHCTLGCKIVDSPSIATFFIGAAEQNTPYYSADKTNLLPLLAVHFYKDRTESHEQLFFACELGTADEGECGGRWNQLLCYP